MDDVGRLTLSLVLILVTLISAFFYMSEISVIGINEHKLKKIMDEKDKRHKAAKALLKLKENASKFSLSTSMIGTLCISSAITLSTVILNEYVHNYFINNKIIEPNIWLSVLCGFVSFFVCALVIIILGQLIPKKIAASNIEKIAFFSIYPLITLIYFFKPFIFIAGIITNLILKIFRFNMDIDNGDVTEEEIRMMVDAGNEIGAIELSEKEMINNIFEFDNRTAVEVMTHRTNIIACKKDDKISDIIYFAINHGFSRIPIYQDNIDNIIGTIYVKDLLCLVGNANAQTFKIEDFIRDVIYIPGSSRCQSLFLEFKTKKIHMAVVVDEYGGTDGIVTMEDLIESIVGDIEDEYDQDEEECTKIDDGSYIFNGSISIDDVLDILDIQIDDTEDGDTLAGAVLNRLEYIPKESEHPSVKIDKYIFTVLSVEEKRIKRIKAVCDFEATDSSDEEK